MNNNELFNKKKKNIKLVVSDIDGTLTDGCLYLTESGEISKRFSFKDIMGLSLLRKNGYKIAFVSGEKTPIIDIYASKLKIEDVYQGIKQKDKPIAELIVKYQLKPANICFIGDDINDIPAMNAVGMPVAVNDCNSKLKKLENVFITDLPGGNGAFRELADLLLE